MRSKVFIPQPIPEVAVDRLKKMADVEVFPYIDRVISREELLKLPLCPRGDSISSGSDRYRAPGFKGNRCHVYFSEIRRYQDRNGAGDSGDGHTEYAGRDHG